MDKPAIRVSIVFLIFLIIVLILVLARCTTKKKQWQDEGTVVVYEKEGR